MTSRIAVSRLFVSSARAVSLAGKRGVLKMRLAESVDLCCSDGE